MELYKNKKNVVEFESPDPDLVVTATWYLNGTLQTTPLVTQSIDEPEMWSATLPFIPAEGTVEIVWTFGLNSISENYDVVTPYLSSRYIKKQILTDSNDEEIREAEAAARFIINAHCGQSFGSWHGTRLVKGNSKSALLLPERLYVLEDITQEIYQRNLYNSLTDFGLGLYQLDGDGWYIKRNAYYVDGIKADAGTSYTVTGPIYDPFRYPGVFGFGQSLLITGSWGYPSVPNEVQEAAKLLVNDYACNDIMYRDKYLESLTSADWRLQYNDGAYAQTGNVRADQLLAKYVLHRGWAVL